MDTVWTPEFPHKEIQKATVKVIEAPLVQPFRIATGQHDSLNRLSKKPALCFTIPTAFPYIWDRAVLTTPKLQKTLYDLLWIDHPLFVLTRHCHYWTIAGTAFFCFCLYLADYFTDIVG